MTILKMIKKLFGYCETCYFRGERGLNCWFKYPYKARQNTAYCDDERNFFVGCKDCHEANDDIWEDTWKNVSPEMRY